MCRLQLNDGYCFRSRCDSGAIGDLSPSKSLWVEKLGLWISCEQFIYVISEVFEVFSEYDLNANNRTCVFPHKTSCLSAILKSQEPQLLSLT